MTLPLEQTTVLHSPRPWLASASASHSPCSLGTPRASQEEQKRQALWLPRRTLTKGQGVGRGSQATRALHTHGSKSNSQHLMRSPGDAEHHGTPLSLVSLSINGEERFRVLVKIKQADICDAWHTRGWEHEWAPSQRSTGVVAGTGGLQPPYLGA